MTKKHIGHLQYSKYPKTMAYTETNSANQTKKMLRYADQTYTLLTDEERKRLKRSQFAFGSAHQYVFDGLIYVATHHKKLLKEVDDLCQVSLMEYQQYNREYFIHELLRRGSTSDKEEDKHLRCIPLGDGKQLSIQPLMIGFTHKTQEIIPPAELKKLMNLTTYSEHARVVNTVRIYVLKLRKYYLFINSIDGSQKSNHIEVDAIDLWEHVSPSEITRNGEYANIRNWDVKRQRNTVSTLREAKNISA
jgi:hypothetical protein